MKILITSNQNLAKYRGKKGKIHHRNIELFLDSIYAEYLSDLDMIVDLGNIFANPTKISPDSLRIFTKFINNSKDLPIFLLQGENDVKNGKNVMQEIFNDVFDNVNWITADHHDNPIQAHDIDTIGATHHHEEIDMDQNRSAHILDTETNILTSIPNNHKWLHTFYDIPPDDFNPENKVVTLKVPHFKYETACKYANDHTNPFTICNVIIDYENTQEKDVPKGENCQTFNDYLDSRIDETFSHDQLSSKILEAIR